MIQLSELTLFAESQGVCNAFLGLQKWPTMLNLHTGSLYLSVGLTPKFYTKVLHRNTRRQNHIDYNSATIKGAGRLKFGSGK